MRSNHDPAIVTLFHSTLEHTLDHFLEFWIFEGVRHFLAIFAQPPTTLLTLNHTVVSVLLTLIQRGIRGRGNSHVLSSCILHSGLRFLYDWIARIRILWQQFLQQQERSKGVPRGFWFLKSHNYLVDKGSHACARHDDFALIEDGVQLLVEHHGQHLVG